MQGAVREHVTAADASGWKASTQLCTLRTKGTKLLSQESACDAHRICNELHHLTLLSRHQLKLEMAGMFMLEPHSHVGYKIWTEAVRKSPCLRRHHQSFQNDVLPPRQRPSYHHAYVDSPNGIPSHENMHGHESVADSASHHGLRFSMLHALAICSETGSTQHEAKPRRLLCI